MSQLQINQRFPYFIGAPFIGGGIFNPLCNYTIFTNGDPDIPLQPTSGSPVSGKDRYLGHFDNQDTTVSLDYITASAHFDTDQDFKLEFMIQHVPSGTTDEGVLTTTVGSSRVLSLRRSGATVNGLIRFYKPSLEFIDVDLIDLFDDEVNYCEVIKTGTSVETKVNGITSEIVDITGYERTGITQSVWGSLIESMSRSINGFLWDTKVSVNGLVLYDWSIDEGSGSIVNDSSGNGNNGIITDGVPVTFWDYYLPYGKEINVDFVQIDGQPILGAPVNINDRYVGFSDGLDDLPVLDYIESSTDFQTDVDFEMDFIFQHEGIGSDFEGFFGCGNLIDTGLGGRRMIIRRNGTTIDSEIIIYNTGGGSTSIVLPGFCDNEEHNWCVKNVSSILTVTRDGVFISDIDITGFTANDIDYTRWLALNFGSTRTANGWVRDIRVIVNSIPTDSYTWKLDEGSGSIATDSSGNGNDGLITDGAPNSFWDYYLPRYMVPATGPMQCRDDSISNINITPVDFSGDWVVSGEMVPYDASGGFGAYFNYGRNNGGASGILSYTQVVGQVSFEIRDDIGTFAYLYVNNNIMDTKFTYEIKKIGTTVLTKINGILVDTDNAVDLTTNGLTIDSVTFGAINVTSSKGEVDHCCGGCDLIDDWNMITRLPSLTDVNANKIIGTTNGIVLDVLDSSPVGMYYPYIGLYDTWYLKEDVTCPDNSIVTHNGIAVTSGGEWVFNN